MLMKYWHMVVISEASDVWNIICHHVQSITSLELKSLVNNPEQHLTCWPCTLHTAATSRAPAPRERLQTRAGVDQWMTRRAARHLASVSQSALHWSCGRQHQLLTPWPMLDHVIMENVIKNQPDWTKPSFYLQKRIQWCFLCSVQSEHLFTILSLMFGCTRVSCGQCVSAWCPGSWGHQETVSSVLVKPGSRSAGGHTRLHPGSPPAPSAVWPWHISTAPHRAPPRHQHPAQPGHWSEENLPVHCPATTSYSQTWNCKRCFTVNNLRNTEREAATTPQPLSMLKGLTYSWHNLFWESKWRLKSPLMH